MVIAVLVAAAVIFPIILKLATEDATGRRDWLQSLQRRGEERSAVR